MEVGLFLLGLLLGILLGWRWLGEQRAASPTHDVQALRERAAAAEGRVRDLEATRDATDARISALEAELANARQAAAEAHQQRQAANTPPEPPAPPPDPAEPLPHDRAPVESAAKPPMVAPDDLTRIKGIGPKLEQKLHEMGITSFRQLAALTPEEAARIDAAIDFPGRIARERWIEQARTLSGG